MISLEIYNQSQKNAPFILPFSCDSFTNCFLNRRLTVCRLHQKQALSCNHNLIDSQGEEAVQNETDVYLNGFCYVQSRFYSLLQLWSSVLNKEGFLPKCFLIKTATPIGKAPWRTSESWNDHFNSFYQSSHVYTDFSERE